jgi:hypothetical protein
MSAHRGACGALLPNPLERNAAAKELNRSCPRVSTTPARLGMGGRWRGGTAHLLDPAAKRVPAAAHPGDVGLRPPGQVRVQPAHAHGVLRCEAGLVRIGHLRSAGPTQDGSSRNGTHVRTGGRPAARSRPGWRARVLLWGDMCGCKPQGCVGGRAAGSWERDGPCWLLAAGPRSEGPAAARHGTARVADRAAEEPLTLGGVAHAVMYVAPCSTSRSPAGAPRGTGQ